MLHRISAQTFVTYVRFVDVSCWFVCEFLLRPCDYANVIIISCEIHLDFVQNEWHDGTVFVWIDVHSQTKNQMCHKHIYLCESIVKRLLFSVNSMYKQIARRSRR